MNSQSHALGVSPRIFLVLQGIGIVALALLLISILSGGKGLLLLAAILALLFAFYLIQKPHWGTLLILALAFVDILPIPIGSPYLKANYLLALLLLIPLALAVFRDRVVWALRVPQVKILLAIGFVFILSTWWSSIKYPVTLLPHLDETAAMMRAFFTRFGYLIFFIYFIRTRKRIEFAAWLTIGLITAAAISALLGLYGASRAVRAAADAGTFALGEGANRLAHICLFAASLIWFYRSYGQSRALRFVALPLLFLLPAMALATGSRSGFLQLLVLAALILWEQEGWSAAMRARSLIFVGCVAIFLMVAAPATQLARVVTYSTAVGDPGGYSLVRRINTVFHSLELAASDPILGIGIGNFVWMQGAFYGLAKAEHNAYLWALMSGGIIALGLYLLLLYITYRMLRQLERHGPRELLWLSKGLRVGFILFLLASVFANFWLNTIFFVIIQTTIAMYYYWQRLRRPNSIQALSQTALPVAPRLLANPI
jgi:O-antigen ligase